MDQGISQKILTKIGLAIFAIALIDLIYLNWWVLESQKSNVKNQSLEQTRKVDTVGLAPSPELDSPPTPSISPSPNTEAKTAVEKQTQTIVQTAQKEIFIPMGSGSTTKDKFTDLTGTDVSIDTNKYPSIDTVTFEASLRVEGGNGRAHAQLINVSDNNPFIESQISSDTSSGVLKTSGKIPIPNGAKTYRIQAKTDITNFPAYVDNARIKITLK